MRVEGLGFTRGMSARTARHRICILSPVEVAEKIDPPVEGRLVTVAMRDATIMSAQSASRGPTKVSRKQRDGPVRVCSPIKMSIEKIDSPTPPQKSPILCKMRLSTGRLLAKRTRLTDVHPSTRGNSTPSEVEMWQRQAVPCAPPKALGDGSNVNIFEIP